MAAVLKELLPPAAVHTPSAQDKKRRGMLLYLLRSAFGSSFLYVTLGFYRTKRYASFTNLTNWLFCFLGVFFFFLKNGRIDS